MKAKYFTVTMALSLTLYAAAAGSQGSSTKSECLISLGDLHDRHASTRKHLNEEERRTAKALRQSSRILFSLGDEDACSETVDALENFLTEKRESMVEEGIVLDLERELRLKELRNARKINAVQAAIRASDFVGSDFRNLHDEALGEIEDVVLDGSNVRTSYLLVSTGGFLGFGDDLIAVPIELVRTTPNFDTIVLDVAQSDLERAPELDESNLNQLDEEGMADK